MRRGYTIIILCFALCAALLAGCGGTAATSVDTAQPTLRVVCTVFPIWDWTRSVIGAEAEGVELTLLLGSGVDLHSFQPGVDDMVTLSRCDLLIYVGGESDDWIADALAESVNPNQRALDLLELLGNEAFTEELREGMQGEAEDAADEHVWLSPRRAALLTCAIADALCELDEAHAARYEANAAAYLEELGGLEADCAALAAADKLPLLVADRFPFRYLAEDCGLDYYAAFSGCSAETGASFETVAFLAGKADEYALPAICVTESPVSGVAEAVRRACQTAAPEIVTLDSMQSVTRAEAESASYVDMMKSNLEAIKLIIQN